MNDFENLLNPLSSEKYGKESEKKDMDRLEKAVSRFRERQKEQENMPDFAHSENTFVAAREAIIKARAKQLGDITDITIVIASIDRCRDMIWWMSHWMLDLYCMPGGQLGEEEISLFKKILAECRATTYELEQVFGKCKKEEAEFWKGLMKHADDPVNDYV